MKRLVIDCETTGLRPNFHQILTVGVVLAEIKPCSLNILDERHFFIKHEQYNVSKTAMRINNINLTEHHEIGILPSLFCKRIDDFILSNDLKNTSLLGHNLHFDLNFLKALFTNEKHLIPFCTKKEDTRYLWEGLKRKGIINPNLNSKLGTIAGHFGIDYQKAHDALADCHITANVYHKMLPLMPKC